ncbi:MAG: DUF2652 domain-containing protein [Bacteroidota bacterium]
MSRPSFLFIPDISGFTQFVNSTEILHSRQIIAELLELIIDHDKLGLEVSEIEGDAILFYKYERVPSPEEILEQARSLFIAFHAHLKQFENDRICNCGACRTASQLTLKIVAHQGEVQLIQVKDHQKLYGPDVIVAHRLLKNDLEGDEYVLITKKTCPLEMDQWQDLEIGMGQAQYDHLAPVPFKYALLSHLHHLVPEPQVAPDFEKTANPVVKEIELPLGIDDAYDLISSLEWRKEWSPGVKSVEYNASRVNRIGTEHTCVISLGELEFETLAANAPAGTRVYAERVHNPPLGLAKSMVNLFELTPSPTGTHVQAEMHHDPSDHLAKLKSSILRMMLGKGLEKSLQLLKSVSKTFSEKRQETIVV